MIRPAFCKNSMAAAHRRATSRCASWCRNRPTSVTMPIVCDDPRSASLVTTAGLMSTHTILHPRRQHVADADAVQHRRQHQHQPHVLERRRVAILRLDAGPSSSRAAARRRGCCRPGRTSTSWRMHSCITPDVSTPCSTAWLQPAGAADRVDRAHVMAMAAFDRLAGLEVDAERGAEQRAARRRGPPGRCRRAARRRSRRG